MSGVTPKCLAWGSRELTVPLTGTEEEEEDCGCGPPEDKVPMRPWWLGGDTGVASISLEPLTEADHPST